MNTYLIDLDNLNSDLCKELIGFILTVGLPFRKIDKHVESKTGRTLVVELETKTEEKALKAFIQEHNISNVMTIKNNLNVVLEGKTIGSFKQVISPIGEHYLDNSTGKKFSIVRE